MNKNLGRKIILVASFLFLFASTLAGRLVYLQYIKYDRFAKKALSQHQIKIELPPRRGDILDRHGEPFAISVASKSVFADPRKISNPEAVAQKLSEILKKDTGKLVKRLSRKKSFVWIQRKVGEKELEKIKALEIPGIYYLEEPKRFYTKGNLLAHILGFVGIDDQGLEGLELSLDKYLKGKSGHRVTGRDRKGREVITMRNEEVPPVDGANVILTVDEVVQHIAEREIDAIFNQSGAQGAMIVVLRPKTGEILAMASRPTYNPNMISKTSADQRRNRAVTDFFEPGSTFKVISCAAALDQKVIRPDEEVFCENGALFHGGHVLHDTHPHGNLTYQGILEKSSNIGTAKIAFRLGGPRLYAYIRRFGFGSTTGIGLKGESPGLVYPPKKWSKYSIVAVPMGQEVAVTALQMTAAMGAIANNGILMRPALIKQIVNSYGKVVQNWEPQAVRQVVSERTSKLIKKALKGVVSRRGTAYRARIPGYTVAGKTGTAQKAVPGIGYAKGKYVASFLGFVPADDPEICVGVFVDEPKGSYYGGVVAAPVFAKVSSEVLKYLDIPPDDVMRAENRLEKEATRSGAAEG